MGKCKTKLIKTPLRLIGESLDFGQGPENYFPRICQNVMYILKSLLWKEALIEPYQ